MQDVKISRDEKSFVTENLEQFGSFVSDVFCPMSCQSNRDNFSAQIDLAQLDKIRMASISSAEMQVRRTKRHIAQVSEGYYLAKFQLSGMSKVVHLNNETILKPGDFVLCSSTEPYELFFDGPYKQAVLTIPHDDLDQLITGIPDQLGRLMPGTYPINGMLSQFVNSLVTHYDFISPQPLRRLEANVLDLLVTSIEASKSDSVPLSKNTQTEHLTNIKRYIAMHVCDSLLTPDSIADAEGISTRYLHMLFKQEGVSVSRYIQILRLEACARMLGDVAQSKTSTMDIAFVQGFNDVSHFHRCFKSHFGTTPRQYRLSALS